MIYIDKSVNGTAGNSILDELLNASWSGTEYIGADYNGLGPYRSRIITLMQMEQTGVCCYCMKVINEKNTTLEHIIPHKINKTGFSTYLTVSELQDHVIYKEDFNRKLNKIPPRRYPHDIAYYNLIASCDSKAHCNHHRDDKKIKLFFYDNLLTTKFEYDVAGLLGSAEYDDDFTKIGVSSNKRLIFIRKLWYKLALNFPDILSVTNDVIDDLILEEFAYASDMKIIEDFIGKPSYKDEIIKYKWFHYYYRNVL